MKFTVLSENLNRALSIVARSVAVRPQLPILGNVLIKATKEGLELLTTDLEMSFRVKIGAKVEIEGEASLPAKTLTELMATIPLGAIEVVLDKETVKMTAGKVKATMSAVSSGEFPAIPEFKGEADLVFDAAEMLKAINRVSISASKDDSRPVFTGILWQFEANKIKLVATDGYRLGVDSLKIEKSKGKELKKLIIPAKSLQELMRVVEKDGNEKIEVKIEDDKAQVLFKAGEVELVSRLLSGEFPPYNQILPSGFKTKVRVGKDELIEAVKRSAIFARESANIVKLQLTESKIQISANGGQTGNSETEAEIEFEGENLTVAFNSRYLLDALSAIEGEAVEFTSEGSLKPGVFVAQSKKSEFLQVVMPVRVQE